MQTAVACPKCSYVRQRADTAPAWQCPSCGIAYVKFRAREAAKHLVVPPKAGEHVPAALDGSIWFLVGVNVLALAVAHFQGWPLRQLLILYWGQSIIIGISYLLRILSLEQFSTENFHMNGRPAEPTPEVKRTVGLFFLVHYGLFHAFYFVFLIVAPAKGQPPPQLGAWFWLCMAAFAANHFWSYRYNREADRAGTPNIGTLMFTPYLRIVPMHLAILSGGLLGQGVLLFGGLKVLADVGMHLIEHAQLQKVRQGQSA